jgi:hypothetical protein
MENELHFTGIVSPELNLDVGYSWPYGRHRGKNLKIPLSGHEALVRWLRGHDVNRAHVCMEPPEMEDAAAHLRMRVYRVHHQPRPQ